MTKDQLKKTLAKWKKGEINVYAVLTAIEQREKALLQQAGVSGSLPPIGDVSILLKGLKRIAQWSDEDEEIWDDPGECATDTIARYKSTVGGNDR